MPVSLSSLIHECFTSAYCLIPEVQCGRLLSTFCVDKLRLVVCLIVTDRLEWQGLIKKRCHKTSIIPVAVCGIFTVRSLLCDFVTRLNKFENVLVVGTCTGVGGWGRNPVHLHGQNDRHTQLKYYLPLTSLAGGKNNSIT